MMILLPIGTDSPSYHQPYATGGMILLNVVVFGLQLAIPGWEEDWILQYGSFNPLTWLTSACMHSGIFHLVGNMLLLALCGWILEGKTGPLVFVGIYFLLAAVSGALEQTMMLFADEGGSLGASSVIFGMVAIMMIWAPENEISILAAGWILFPFVHVFQVSVLLFSFAMIAVEFFWVAISAFAMSSALLHLLGAIPGAMLGYAMVKLRWVDCEGFDLISIQQGKRGQRVKTVQQERRDEQLREQQKQDLRDALQLGREKIDEFLASGHFEMALHRYQGLKRKHHRFQLTEHQWVELIRGLWSNESTRERAIPIIESYLEEFETLRVPLTLRLAKYRLLSEHRPRACRKLLGTIADLPMDPQQSRIARQLADRSRQMIDDGVLDLAD